MPLHWRKARSWRGSLFPETLSQGSHIQPLHQLPVRDDQKGGAKPEHKGHARKEHGPDVPGKEDRLKRRVEMPRWNGQRKVLQRVGHTVDVKNEPGQDDGGQKAGDQPGLGGKKLWREHALGSARVISAIKPEYVGFLTLMIEPGTEMYDQYNRGEIELLTPHEVLDETELFIRSVDAEGTMFRSNHASNYIPLGGTLNGERDKILGQIEISRRKSKFRPDVFRGI